MNTIITFINPQQYSVAVEEDTLSDGRKVYTAHHPELIGCKAQGETLEEAYRNLMDALQDYMDALFWWEMYLPPPTRVVVSSRGYYYA